MKLAGIELRNFRSIGTAPVILTPWRKCNILSGQNNAGKSNVIKAIQRISERIGKGKGEGLIDLDFHKRSSENKFQFKLYFESDNSDEDKNLKDKAKIASLFFDISWDGNPDVTDYTFADYPMCLL
jgi:AAA15 family ATPase/GTPase